VVVGNLLVLHRHVAYSIYFCASVLDLVHLAGDVVLTRLLKWWLDILIVCDKEVPLNEKIDSCILPSCTKLGDARKEIDTSKEIDSCTK
jgi:hypothetical protein